MIAMIIFQTMGGHAAGLLDGSLLKDKFAPATTFRNNAYIHRLNRTLQGEMRVLSAYRSLTSRSLAGATGSAAACTPQAQIERNVDNHQAAGKALVRLIIANRGIPEDRSALSFGLTKTLIHLCASVPGRIFERATIGSLVSLERQLVGSYRKLINEAPLRDVPILEDLLRKSEEHGDALAEQRF